MVDEAGRGVEVIATGEFDRNVFLEMLERMRAEGTWSYVTLEIRGMTFFPRGYPSGVTQVATHALRP